MKVLIFHGYLLRGTGSNVYNASLARALAALGHEVHLRLPGPRRARRSAPARPGSVTIHNPDIGGLLPVFVHDTYEGFEVKTFAELTDAELDRYIEPTSTAVARVVESLGGVDAALANHLVMGPVILARAGLALRGQGPRLRPLLHGPARPRALPALRPGGAATAPPGSWSAPGTSPSACARRSTTRRPTPRSGSARRASTPSSSPRSPPADAHASRSSALAARAARAPSAGGPGTSSWDRDPGAAADAVEWFAEGDGPAGGLRRQADRLQGGRPAARRLAARPRATSRRPAADRRLRGARAGAAAALDGLAAGDLGPLRELAERGRGLEGGRGRARSRCSRAFLERAAGRLRGARPGRPPAASASPAGSSTTRSPCPCPRPTRSSSRAPSPRRSGWSPPRPRRPGCCRSRPRTRAPPRSAASSPPSLPRRSPGWSRSSSTTTRSRRSPTRLNGWLALDAAERDARERLAARDGRAALELGGGRARRARGAAGRARRPAAAG